MGPDPVDLGVSTALGLGEAAIGLINEGKANREAKQLKATRPKLGSSPFLQDALSEAESAYSTGMSPEAKTAYEEDLDKDLSTSVGATLRMGGSPNNVASIFAGSAVGRQRLAIMKDQLRMSNLNNLYRAQTAMEEQRQKQFEFNNWMPWADASQANAEAKKTSQSEIFGGLNTAAGGVMRFGEAKDAANQYRNYFSKPSSGGGGDPNANLDSFIESLLNK